MKRIAWIMSLLVGITPTAALAQQAPRQAQRQYLRLGADPQAANRQPGPGEVVIVANHDVCDTGWGTGSGKRVKGCYPAHTAYIAKLKAGAYIATAAFVCGNEPEEEHPITGKVLKPEDIATSMTPTGELQVTIKVDGESKVIHSGMVRVVHEYAPSPASSSTVTVDEDDDDGMPTWAKVTLGAIGAALIGGGSAWAYNKAKAAPRRPILVDTDITIRR